MHPSGKINEMNISGLMCEGRLFHHSDMGTRGFVLAARSGGDYTTHSRGFKLFVIMLDFLQKDDKEKETSLLIPIFLVRISDISSNHAAAYNAVQKAAAQLTRAHKRS